jgi:hypothetical protein
MRIPTSKNHTLELAIRSQLMLLDLSKKVLNFSYEWYLPDLP